MLNKPSKSTTSGLFPLSKVLKTKTAVLFAGRVDTVGAGDVVVVVVVDFIVVEVVVVDVVVVDVVVDVVVVGEVINGIVVVVVDVFDNELRLVIGID